jgi:hypothetical protein
MKNMTVADLKKALEAYRDDDTVIVGVRSGELHEGAIVMLGYYSIDEVDGVPLRKYDTVKQEVAEENRFHPCLAVTAKDLTQKP